jgi:hypothetical protein
LAGPSSAPTQRLGGGRGLEEIVVQLDIFGGSLPPMVSLSLLPDI